MTDIKKVSTEINIIANAMEAKRKGLDKLYVAGLIYDYLTTKCSDSTVFLYAEAMNGNIEGDEYYNIIYDVSSGFNKSLWKDEIQSKCTEALALINNPDETSDLRTALCCYTSEWDD